MSTPERCALVVGNSVAAMISAISLAEAGWRVQLVTPSHRLGGHFAGLTLGGQTLDAGMVFLEFTSFNAEPTAAISSYDPRRRNDVGRFFPMVEATLRRFGEWNEVESPCMRVQGRILPDLLIANRTSSLIELAPDTRDAMANELRAIVAQGRGPLHASRKVTAQAYSDLDLQQASLANHGRTFHELLIEPFCQKVTGRSTATLLARFHRLAWVPLFYPETLAGEFGGAGETLPATVFSYPTLGSVATLIQKIGQHLRATRGVTILEDTITSLRHAAGSGTFVLQTATGQEVTGDRLVWGADQERLLNVCGEDVPAPMDKASMVLASALVKTEELLATFSTLLVPENSEWPFRVTNQSVAAGEAPPLSRLSCEWNADFVKGSADELAWRTRAALTEMGIVRDPDAVSEMRVDVMKDALLLPSPSNAARWAERQELLQAMLPTVPRLGPAAPFGATSLNDQIVQGMKVVHDLRALT